MLECLYKRFHCSYMFAKFIDTCFHVIVLTSPPPHTNTSPRRMVFKKDKDRERAAKMIKDEVKRINNVFQRLSHATNPKVSLEGTYDLCIAHWWFTKCCYIHCTHVLINCTFCMCVRFVMQFITTSLLSTL